MPLVEIDWWDHPRITEVWDLVKKLFDEDCSSSFETAISEDSYSIQDYRTSALRWIEDLKEMLEKLEEKVKALPLDARESMMVEEALL